ncbi:hypothetical protein OHA45_04440 [Streptomyces lydicus]|uniref:hypothetical protein n=1 Tax=Streptomyces lydicus TaxID=47763 RepID=UPI002E37F185|nr:hypothetical protein [Streptomyces lydicus]
MQAAGRWMIAVFLSAGLSACATGEPAPDRPTPGRSGSEDGSQTSAGTPGASGGGHFVFYTYRVSAGVEYLDLLDWTTHPGGTVAGTYTAVLLSKSSPGGEKRSRRSLTGTQQGSSVTLIPVGMSGPPVHGKISGDTLTTDSDLSAETFTYKATDPAGFDKIVSRAKATPPPEGEEMSPGPTTPGPASVSPPA